MLDKYVWTNAHTQVSLLAGRDSLWLARALGARRTTFRILFSGTQIVHPRARCGQRGFNRTPPETSPPLFCERADLARDRVGFGSCLQPLGKLLGISSPGVRTSRVGPEGPTSPES